MKIIKIKLEKIQNYKQNTRMHSSRQIKQIKKSIEHFGFKSPILLDEKLKIIAGMGERKPLKRLKGGFYYPAIHPNCSPSA